MHPVSPGTYPYKNLGWLDLSPRSILQRDRTRAPEAPKGTRGRLLMTNLPTRVPSIPPYGCMGDRTLREVDRHAESLGPFANLPHPEGIPRRKYPRTPATASRTNFRRPSRRRIGFQTSGIALYPSLEMNKRGACSSGQSPSCTLRGFV